MKKENTSCRLKSLADRGLADSWRKLNFFGDVDMGEFKAS
jgi:hypothetical protein